MKNEELPYLNLDRATSLYLPLEPIEARAHYRFAFRLANGDEEWLLARLCVIRPDRDNDQFQHCVVLRPENAEAERIFVTESLFYKSGQLESDSWMTPAAAKKFKWDLFEQSLNDLKHGHVISRFWSSKEKGKTTLLKFDAYGWGKIVGFISQTENTIHKLAAEDFICRRSKCGETCLTLDAKFLRKKDKNFRRKVRSLWNDQNSQIQYALYWMHLSDVQRNTIAFECKKGSWQALTEVAKLVLKVRLDRLKKVTETVFKWDFVNYDHVSVRGASELHDDNCLFIWRFALAYAFETTNIGVAGVRIDSLPLSLWKYILNYDQEPAQIKVSLPSKHELIEATLQLNEWAKTNFSNENARILMNSFSHCSEEDKEKFYTSLNANDSL